MSEVAEALVRTGRWTADEQAAIFAATPRLAAGLADNQAIVLDDNVWLGLYKLKPIVNSDVASSLARRKLTNEQLEHMLAGETRLTPWVCAIMCNELTPDQQRRLLNAGVVKGAVAARLVEAPWLDASLGTDIALRAGGSVRWSHLTNATAQELSDAEAAAWVASLAEWQPAKFNRSQAAAVERLIEHRRFLVPAFAEPTVPELVRRQLAGSRLITDEAVQHRLTGIDGVLDLDLKSMSPEEWRKHTWLLTKLVFSPVCARSTLEGLAAFEGVHQLAADIPYKASNRLRRYEDRPTVTEAYSEVSNPQVLSWLIGRALPNDTYERPFPGRPWDLAELCRNPNLEQRDASRVLGALRDHFTTTTLGADALTAERALLELHPELGEPEITLEAARSPQDLQLPEREASWPDDDGALAADKRVSVSYASMGSRFFASQLGGAEFAQRWSLLVSLIDGYEGTFAELAELVTLMADTGK